MVVSNSMRKIEQLLTSEAEHKRIIHELQLKLDSKNVNEEYEAKLRGFKKNEKQYT